jgi:hypothetical protein
VLNYAARFDVAYGAAVEALLAGERDPLAAARDGITYASLAERHHHGIVEAARGGGVSRAFARFWNGARVLESPFEDRIVEELAVRQILAILNPRWRQILVDYANGEPVSQQRLSDARAAFREWWFEGETPGRLYGRDRGGHVPGRRYHRRQKLRKDTAA